MKLMVFHRQILFNLAIAVIAETIMMRTSAEQVPPESGMNGSRSTSTTIVQSLIFIIFIVSEKNHSIKVFATHGRPA